MENVDELEIRKFEALAAHDAMVEMSGALNLDRVIRLPHCE